MYRVVEITINGKKKKAEIVTSKHTVAIRLEGSEGSGMSFNKEDLYTALGLDAKSDRKD